MTGTNGASRFRSFFAERKVVLPVVHVEEEGQALRNVELAVRAGADGAFLINHAIDAEELLAICGAVRARFPGAFLGVNCLDLSPVEMFERLPAGVDGVWVDDAMIDERADAQPDAERVVAARRGNGERALYFGGVAFKYRRRVADPAMAARAASGYVDVVTTSGPGTGEAADPRRIRAMKEALGAAPLALASGVTPENVRDYLPWVDAFLVATGISRSFSELDQERLVRLLDAVGSDRG